MKQIALIFPKVIFYSFSIFIIFISREKQILNDTLSGLRQFLATGSPLKMLTIAFYFMLKALFVLKILKFLSSLVGQVEKRLD